MESGKRKDLNVVSSSSSIEPMEIDTRVEDAEKQLANRQQVLQPVVKFAATKNPKETLKAVYSAGEYKAGLPLKLLMVHTFMAGVYIALAGHLYLAIGGGILGSALFPTGLIAVILTSAELFTGDAFVFVASVLGGRVSVEKLCRNWTVAWIFNFLGAFFWALVLAYSSDSLEDLGVTDLAITVALKKTKAPWISIFLKGVGANFMVCLGIWQATCAEEVAGMLLGADISIGKMFYALSASTLGNIVGGAAVGIVYWYVYDSMVSIY